VAEQIAAGSRRGPAREIGAGLPLGHRSDTRRHAAHGTAATCTGESISQRLKALDEYLKIDATPERALPVAGLPVASADLQHHLSAPAFEISEIVLGPLVCDPEAEHVAPEAETGRQVADDELGHQRREAASGSSSIPFVMLPCPSRGTR
jgi:hypothetical protein